MTLDLRLCCLCNNGNIAVCNLNDADSICLCHSVSLWHFTHQAIFWRALSAHRLCFTYCTLKPLYPLQCFINHLHHFDRCLLHLPLKLSPPPFIVFLISSSHTDFLHKHYLPLKSILTTVRWPVKKKTIIASNIVIPFLQQHHKYKTRTKLKKCFGYKHQQRKHIHVETWSRVYTHLRAVRR